jgi:dihydroorotase
MLIAVHCEDEDSIRRNTQAAIDRFGEDIPVYYHPIIRNDEACYLSSRLAVDLARQFGTRLHILHLSTAKELGLLDAGIPLKDKKITAEVCVHHLFFDDRDYHTHGNLIKWNPAIKTSDDREALIAAVNSGKIDVVATDHAPHTLDEKKQTYLKAPSGGPLVQHSLNVMLELSRQGAFPIETVVEKMCHAPAILFGVEERGFIREGFFADLVVVDPDNKWTVGQENILYKCQWSPLAGTTFGSRITHTLVNGNLVYDRGQFNETVKGRRLTFKPGN